MKKCFALMLALILGCTGLFTGVLAEGKIQPFNSNYYHSYGTSMSSGGNGVLNITFDVMAMGICSQLGVASYEVQRHVQQANGEWGWLAVSELLPGETGSNVVSYTFSRTFQGVPGETYRVKVTFFCAMGSGFEHKLYTSTGVTVE